MEATEGKPKSLFAATEEGNSFTTIPSVDVSTRKGSHIISHHHPFSRQNIINAKTRTSATNEREDYADLKANEVKRPSQNLLKIILDLGYCAGLMPYHITDSAIHRNKLQMAYCIVFQTVAILSLLNHVRLSKDSEDMPSGSPTTYFQVFRRVTIFVAIASWIKTVWQKPNEMRNFVQQSSEALTGNYRKNASRFIVAVCILYSSSSVLGSLVIIEKSYWDPVGIINAYAGLARRTLRLENTSFESRGDFQISLENTLLFSFQFSLELCHDATIWFLYMTKLSIAIVIWFNVKKFEDDLSNSCSSSLDAFIICQKFSALKEMFNNASSILGLFLLVWIGYIVPFTSLRISGIISRSDDWFFVTFNLIYLFHVVAFFVLAADSCTKVGHMKQWLIRDDIMTHFEEKKYNALLMELSSSPVAIQSYGEAFSVTYGFIGNIFTLMTSFFIIITQVSMTTDDK